MSKSEIGGKKDAHTVAGKKKDRTTLFGSLDFVPPGLKISDLVTLWRQTKKGRAYINGNVCWELLMDKLILTTHTPNLLPKVQEAVCGSFAYLLCFYKSNASSVWPNDRTDIAGGGVRKTKKIHMLTIKHDQSWGNT